MAGNDGYFPVEQVASLIKLTPRRLQQLADSGVLGPNARAERGRYHLVYCVQGYIDYLKSGDKEQQRGQAQARLARAQAVKVELQNFRSMGELIVKEQSDETNQSLVNLIRSSHEGLAGRLSSELAPITDPTVIYQRLQAESRAILNQCADLLEKRAAALEAMPEPGLDRQAEHEATPDGVGEQEPGDAGGQS